MFATLAFMVIASAAIGIHCFLYWLEKHCPNPPVAAFVVLRIAEWSLLIGDVLLYHVLLFATGFDTAAQIWKNFLRPKRGAKVTSMLDEHKLSSSGTFDVPNPVTM